MNNIQRYGAWPQEWPFEDDGGDLVTYEDHRKIVDELEAKLAKANLLAGAIVKYRTFVFEHTAEGEVVPMYTQPAIELQLALTAYKGQDDD